MDVIGENYCLVGLYNDRQCKTEVEMLEPEFRPMKGAVEAMRKKGVKVPYHRSIVKNLAFHG